MFLRFFRLGISFGDNVMKIALHLFYAIVVILYMFIVNHAQKLMDYNKEIFFAA